VRACGKVCRFFEVSDDTLQLVVLARDSGARLQCAPHLSLAKLCRSSSQAWNKGVPQRLPTAELYDGLSREYAALKSVVDDLRKRWVGKEEVDGRTWKIEFLLFSLFHCPSVCA